MTMIRAMTWQKPKIGSTPPYWIWAHITANFGLCPIGSRPRVLAWNKSIFEEVGLDPEKPPTSFESWTAWRKSSPKMEGSQITRMGHMPANYWLWAAAWNGKFYDADNRKVTANDPANIAMFEWMATYSKKYDVTKVQAFEQGLASERAGVLDPFISGRIAIHEIGGAWKLGDFYKYADQGFRYGIIPAIDPVGCYRRRYV